MEAEHELEPHLVEVLDPGETVRLKARSNEAVLAVTDRRLVVAAPQRIALAVPFRDLRRIQFDIEKDRPATLVVVPEDPWHEPQVLSIAPEAYRATADALVTVGLHLADEGRKKKPRTSRGRATKTG
jgi:hypothetical protein